MARIIVGSWMIRYPLGGNLSWALQYLVGLKKLGHDVYFVEKWVYDNSCYDPGKKQMSNDCSYGLKMVSELLSRFGFNNKWCFVEKGEIYHGLTKQKIEDVFRTADVFIDTGSHGGWDRESVSALRVFIDVDPAYTQIKWNNNLQEGLPIPLFDHYYTIGRNVGTVGNEIPVGNIKWKYIFNPVNTHLFHQVTPPPHAPYSTIMNWQSYNNVQHNGNTYGQKDIEFPKFESLPQLVNTPLEMAVSGLDGSRETMLQKQGWRISDAQQITYSYDTFCNYLSDSRGEFSVCKNVYVATLSGWFSDKSAAYLASSRPVVVQDTGFSKHLPVGEGLFGFTNVSEAQYAIEEIEGNYLFHSRRAREIAGEYLEATTVLKRFLDEIGI